jgi:hypothetical protein
MSRYFINILFMLLSFSASAQETDDEDIDDEPKTPVINVDSFSQLRFGIDISRPVWNYLTDSRTSYEFELDYYFKKELYFAFETGWGNAEINYPDLKFKSTNSYYRGGITKGMLKRQSSQDWDMAFIGFRYGLAPIQRSEASYIVIDSFWGNTTGTVPSKNMTLHWAEVVGGVKVELVKGLFLGWTARAKFRLNKKPFQELPPSYITGYGKGDKGTIFDFNVYVDYAIRWRREKKEEPKIINKDIAIPAVPSQSDSTGKSSGKKWKGTTPDTTPKE